MTFEAYVHGFGCLPTTTPYEQAHAVVLPIPLEWGSGEAPGVGLGPLAVLGASRFLETYDTDLGFDPLDRPVATLDAPEFSFDAPARPLEQIQAHVSAVYQAGKRPVCIGGDRVIVVPAVKAASEHFQELGAILIARRPGWIDRDHGRLISPLTLGRRLSELLQVVVVGSRWWNAEEAAFGRRQDGPLLIPSREVPLFSERIDEIRQRLPSRIHLSIDVGVLDPAYMPIAGNVEPGGLDWYGLIDLMDEIFASFTVVGCDVSGFSPVLGQVAPAMHVAQLVLRCLGRMT